MKILHCADLHIREKDIDEITTCLEFLVTTAEKEAVDLVVIAGDIFDSQEIKVDSKSAKLAMRTVSHLADIAPVAIVIGTLSHDGRAPEILSFARGKYDVQVSSMPEQIYLYQGYFYTHLVGNIKPDAILSMVPTPTKQFFQTASGILGADQEIGQAMSGLFLGFGAACAEFKAPHISIWHGGLSGVRIPSGHVLTRQDVEISTDQIRLAGGSHDFLGCFYPGPLSPVKIDEQECGFYIHTLEERDFIGCLGHIHQPQHIGAENLDVPSRWVATPFTRTIRFEHNYTMDEYGPLDEDKATSIEGLAGSHVRYDFTAWQDEAGKLDKEKITKELMDAGALSVDIRITRIPRVQVRSESVLSAESLADKLIAAAALRDSIVSLEALEMAGLLEHTPAEQLLAMVVGGEV